MATSPASGGGALTAAARASATRGPGPIGTGAPGSRTGPVSGAAAGAAKEADGTGGSYAGGGGTTGPAVGRGPGPVGRGPWAVVAGAGLGAGRPPRRDSIRATA
ncbi:hypothetical protein SRO_4193 [Streptomyces rochei]|nr:hypothetical protein SRO_4193 [Streptomyces rochei]